MVTMIPKTIFNLQKNSLLHRLSHVEETLSVVNNIKTSNNDYLLKSMEELKTNDNRSTRICTFSIPRVPVRNALDFR